MEGMLNILKPPGMTSHDVVDFIRKIYNIRKVGHTGTLDPDAAGILPVCVGNATKFVSYLLEHDKRYRFEITFGFTTDTLDKSGKIVKSGPVRILREEELRQVLNEFKGKIKQIPPMYSAKKIKGKKLYEYAREGKTIDIPPIEVTIYDIELVEYEPPYRVLIDVKCSKGTYVRALVRDICEKLNMPGYMSMLIRTEVGAFKIEDAYTLEEIREKKVLLQPIDKFIELPSVQLNKMEAEKILKGQFIQNRYPIETSLLKLYDNNGKFLGIGILERNKIRPKRLLWGGNDNLQIVYESNASKYKEAKVIALGNFDGVHIGHQELIKQAIALSKENNLASAVFTFKQHTSKILTPDKQPELITTYQKKVEILKQFNLDYGIFFDFTESFSKLTAEEFIKKILVELLNIKIAVVGHNYRFGYKALGNVDTLKKYSKIYSYKVYVVPPVIREGIVVSSSYIRELIKSGKVEEANSLLGRFFPLQGKVIHGQEIGRKLGFPTANLQISEDLVLPKAGVYVTRVKIEDKFYIAVTNVGSKPTFGGKSISVESYILDYNENLYDKYLEVEFITRIRDEIKFQNLEALKEQVFKDINYAKNFKNILQQKHYVIK